MTTAKRNPYHLSKKLTHRAIVSARGLLPMPYRLAEVCAKLVVAPGDVREWMRNGLPFQRDARGHLWIDGCALADWVETIRRTRPRQKMKSDEAHCFRCRRAVPIVNPVERRDGRHVLLTATCPHCGCTVNRGGMRD